MNKAPSFEEAEVLRAKDAAADAYEDQLYEQSIKALPQLTGAEIFVPGGAIPPPSKLAWEKAAKALVHQKAGIATTKQEAQEVAKKFLAKKQGKSGPPIVMPNDMVIHRIVCNGVEGSNMEVIVDDEVLAKMPWSGTMNFTNPIHVKAGAMLRVNVATGPTTVSLAMSDLDGNVLHRQFTKP